MVDVHKVAVADKWNKHLLMDGKKWLKWHTQMQSFSFSVSYDINVQPTGRYLLCSDLSYWQKVDYDTLMLAVQCFWVTEALF